MGTHRSRHNKGRKPFYKEHRLIATHLLANPMYPGWSGCRGDVPGNNGWYNTRTWWTPEDKFALEVLCEADAPIDGAADALGRKPTSIAHRAKDFGITLPAEWARLIAPKRALKLRAQREPALAYPFIAKVRPEHADLLAINEIVPKTMPDQMRADICQEIMVAILEGRTTLDALKAKKGSASYYIKRFWRENYEDSGCAISFHDTHDDWDSDAVASSIAAREWHERHFEDRTSAVSTYRTFTPPTQFEAAWNDQVGRAVIRAQELGRFLSHDEMAELMEASE